MTEDQKTLIALQHAVRCLATIVEALAIQTGRADLYGAMAKKAVETRDFSAYGDNITPLPRPNDAEKSAFEAIVRRLLAPGFQQTPGID